MRLSDGPRLSEGEIIGQEVFKKPCADFLVREVERVDSDFFVESLDGQIAALVEQWGERLHVFRWCVKFISLGCHASNLAWQHIKFLHHVQQVGRWGSGCTG